MTHGALQVEIERTVPGQGRAHGRYGGRKWGRRNATNESYPRLSEEGKCLLCLRKPNLAKPAVPLPLFLTDEANIAPSLDIDGTAAVSMMHHSDHDLRT